MIVDPRPHEAAVKFACWMASLMADTAATPKQIQSQVNAYKRLVGSRTKGKQLRFLHMLHD